MTDEQRENNPDTPTRVVPPSNADDAHYVVYVSSPSPDQAGARAKQAETRFTGKSRQPDGAVSWKTLALLLAFLALFGAWHFGLLDHLFYLRDTRTAAEAAASVESEPATSPTSSAAASNLKSSRNSADAHYVYSQLIEEDQEKYRIMLDALQRRVQSPYPSGDIGDVEHIFRCVTADHPELFYATGIGLHTETNSASGVLERAYIEGDYACSAEEEGALMRQMDAAASLCLAQAPAEAESDDYALAKYLYEWMASHVTYNAAAAGAQDNARDDNRTMVGALLNGQAVCSGYASAYQYVMQKAGLQCTQVSGEARGGSHAWCLALLDGSYYYVDPTWGDPQSLEGNAAGETDFGFTNYDYLCVPESILLRNHAPDDAFILPSCTAVDDNYYVREGLLFDAPDEGRFAALAANALSAGTAFQMQCADVATYTHLRDAFVASGSLAASLPEGAYRYSFSDELFSISIFPA